MISLLDTYHSSMHLMSTGAALKTPSYDSIGAHIVTEYGLCGSCLHVAPAFQCFHRVLHMCLALL
jgi:hypothetical protein